MCEGVLFFDRQQERYDIRFNDEKFYGGLHCGDYFEVYYNEEWIATRTEYGKDWYFVGLSKITMDGLKVRI